MNHVYLTTTHLTALGYNNDPGTTITLPVGRIVWGHPGKPKPATDNRNQPKIGKDGQQMMETSFGLAIPEADFIAIVEPVMHAEMSKGYPNGAPSNFSWKITRPTEVDNNGKPYNEREGYAGHVVLAVSTTLEPPGIFRHDGTKWQQMQPDEIKCGDYVQAEINFKVNVPTDRTHTSSLYVNPRAIAFAGYGSAIQTGFHANPEQAFGSGPPPLPPGASATPVGNAASQPGMPGAPGNAPMPGTTTAPPANTAVPQPAASAAPAPGNAPPPPPTPPAAPAGPQRPTEPTHIHDNGNGTEQWFVNGAWDGGAHPVATLPPPATGFVANAAGMPPAPAPAAAPTMPGAPPPR